MIGTVTLAVHLQRVRFDEASAAVDPIHFRVGEVGFVPLVDALDVVLTLGDQSRPVKTLALDIEAIIDSLVQRVGEHGAAPHHFLGHAPAVDTSTA
jgi:hypothetical protein